MGEVNVHSSDDVILAVKGGLVQDQEFLETKIEHIAGCIPICNKRTTIMSDNREFMLHTRPAPPDVKLASKALAIDIVHYCASSTTRLPRDVKADYTKTLRRQVDKMSIKHEIVFRNMITKLCVTQETAVDTFTNVTTEIFRDTRCNWGRIVSVYAFAGWLAKYFKDELNMPEYVDDVGIFAGQYIADRLGWWINANGGWDAFVEYFPSPTEFEDKIWKGLLYTAVGLGALATVVAAR